jgi:hypothetical protein
MDNTKTILLSHVFNEEYLLPFWLHHHKNMFDEIIIIDYNSTDKSMEICKNICPECKIIKTRNKFFEAEETDKEIMDIENSIQGIKIALNTTEFLFIEKPIKDIFQYNKNISYGVNCISPYSMNTYNINNYYELLKNLLNDNIRFHHDRRTRQLHNYPNGKYTIGRHDTLNVSAPTNEAHIIWFGYYPMNEKLLKRKLQIGQNIPQSDKDRHFGYQHYAFDKDKLLSINKEKYHSGKELKCMNLSLYNLLNNIIQSLE